MVYVWGVVGVAARIHNMGCGKRMLAVQCVCMVAVPLGGVAAFAVVA